MDLTSLVIFLLIGLAAGWLAGQIMKTSFSMVGNLIVGVVGAVIGGWVFSSLGISIGTPLIGSLIAAVVGAVILLWVIGLVKKA